MDGRLTAGQAQLQAGNTFAAIRSAKQVLQDDPQDTNALELLCCAHMAERDYMSAQDVLDGWLRITPDDPDAHWTQILLQMSLGRQDDAKQRIAQFEQSFPESVHLTIWLQAMWQEAFGSPDKAIALYRTLLEREPGDISLIRRIALTEVEARNIIAASELMQDVLAHNANDADALRTLAISELKTFRFASARELATAAQAANPRDLAMKKVKWLSWIVLFPPFLAGHVLHYLIAYVRYAAGSIAAHGLCGLTFAAMIGGIIYSNEVTNAGDTLPIETSLILATFFLAGCWALPMYYIFGIGNADEDQLTATLSGGY